MEIDILIDELTDCLVERFVTDGRLTEPSGGKRFEWRKMIDEVKKIGRPLTEDEAEKFKIK